ncbi:MAG TPA: carboxypeptidase regulatory-like domain-containing protein [Bryobacteraceae bacterium]|nr:carboxypeptidase regulatory-like domain-containing protein [Bryobacteraceae bacterium]
MRTACLLCFIASLASAQDVSVHGRVTDPSGAIVSSAAVTLEDSTGHSSSSSTGADGIYSLSNLHTGDYRVTAQAPQLSFPSQTVTLRSGPNTIDIRLALNSVSQKVAVNAGESAVSTDPAASAGALILKGADLDALGDDPEDLAADLQALAGPAAGPGGGAIFVDGFSGGQLPPKQSIREIRVNQNPFAAEYDKLGYGKIEIFTKPGSDQFHGTVGYNLGTDVWNSRNPYSATRVPFLLQETENSFSGPLTKRSSWTLDFERQAVNNGSVTNGVTLKPDLQPEPFSSVFNVKQRHWLVGPHVDYQLSPANTLSLRYLWTSADIPDAGIGSFDLISRASHAQTIFHTAQGVFTTIHGTKVNETRFQYFRSLNQTTAATIAPVVQVSGAFTGGGANAAASSDLQNNYELQNFTSIVHGTHLIRFGMRLRRQLDDNYSPANFNGTFTFAGGLAPALDAADDPLPGDLVEITSIEQYRRTLLFQSRGYTPAEIAALGGGASQFTISTGQPELNVGRTDIGLSYADDWRLRPNMTISLGLRYEDQTNISDHKDFAPRFSFAWAPGARAGKTGKTVLRAGWGMFYDRFPLSATLAVERNNGIVQRQYVLTDPSFYPVIPPLNTLALNAARLITQAQDANLRAPYLMQTAASFERQLPAKTSLAITYTNALGVHQFRSEVLHSGAGGSPEFLMTSDGVYRQNQVIFNVATKFTSAISLNSYYAWNRVMSNTDGLNSFPANPADFSGEYGPAANDIRHRFLLAGTINLRWNIRLSPNITLQSGAPFNITSGEDFYGTTLFNARPGIASGPGPGIVLTSYGYLNTLPWPNEPILPRNFGRGPGQESVNLRVGKSWGFGHEKGQSGAASYSHDGGGAASGPALSVPTRGVLAQGAATASRYNISVGMSARNLLNHTNPGPIIGSITSPLFGQSNQVAGAPNGEGFSENASNRRLELQIRFTY